jgi:hypothetical protein
MGLLWIGSAGNYQKKLVGLIYWSTTNPSGWSKSGLVGCDLPIWFSEYWQTSNMFPDKSSPVGIILHQPLPIAGSSSKWTANYPSTIFRLNYCVLMHQYLPRVSLPCTDGITG